MDSQTGTSAATVREIGVPSNRGIMDWQRSAGRYPADGKGLG